MGEEGKSPTIKRQLAKTPDSRKGMSRTPFPYKVHVMLEDAEEEEHTSIVSWSADGRSFKVHMQKDFLRIMTKYFKQTKYKSFQRQLYIYGFDRIRGGPDKGGYRHPMFVKWDRELCKEMTTKKVVPNNAEEQKQGDQASSPMYGAMNVTAYNAQQFVPSPSDDNYLQGISLPATMPSSPNLARSSMSNVGLLGNMDSAATLESLRQSVRQLQNQSTANTATQNDGSSSVPVNNMLIDPMGGEMQDNDQHPFIKMGNTHSGAYHANFGSNQNETSPALPSRASLFANPRTPFLASNPNGCVASSPSNNNMGITHNSTNASTVTQNMNQNLSLDKILEETTTNKQQRQQQQQQASFSNTMQLGSDNALNNFLNNFGQLPSTSFDDLSGSMSNDLTRQFQQATGQGSTIPRVAAAKQPTSISTNRLHEGNTSSSDLFLNDVENNMEGKLPDVHEWRSLTRHDKDDCFDAPI